MGKTEKTERVLLSKISSTEVTERVYIENKIYEVRGQKVIFDFDLARLFEVETRVLNQAVKRNIDSFPEDFMFQLSFEEWEARLSQIVVPFDYNLKSQNVTSSWGADENFHTLLPTRRYYVGKRFEKFDCAKNEHCDCESVYCYAQNDFAIF